VDSAQQKVTCASDNTRYIEAVLNAYFPDARKQKLSGTFQSPPDLDGDDHSSALPLLLLRCNLGTFLTSRI